MVTPHKRNRPSSKTKINKKGLYQWYPTILPITPSLFSPSIIVFKSNLSNSDFTVIYKFVYHPLYVDFNFFL